MSDPTSEPTPQVGICVLNYHQPEATVRCVESLLKREPATTRILWIENDADATEASLRDALEKASFPWRILETDADAPPPPGEVGVILSPSNLGYAGGNNLGLRLLHRWKVAFAWVLNNDTELMAGSSSDLVAAAESRPEVGAWGTAIHARHKLGPDELDVIYFGGIVSLKDFRIHLAQSADALGNTHAYISGCSLFSRTDVFAEVGFIPEDYFLYYEDPAFTYELKKRGYQIAPVESVRIDHAESLSTGRRSPLMEYYNRRNRWHFIERYHPDLLRQQKRRIWYTTQKLLFRLQFRRTLEEWLAFWDYRKGKLGPTDRRFSRESRA